MPEPSPKQIADAVLNGYADNQPRSQVVKRLVALGLTHQQAESAATRVEDGFKAGNLAAATGGRIGPGEQPKGRDPLFDYAFKRGKSRF